MDETELESVLLQFGQLGRFQLLNYLAISLPLFVSAMYSELYVFEADSLTHRCLVPECEGNGSTTYLPSWLPYAVPYDDGSPSSCERYVANSPSANVTTVSSVCHGVTFSTEEEECSEWVFEPGQRSSVVSEWDLVCDDSWEADFVGTVGNFGQFVGMPIAGVVSDRYGRKSVILWGWAIGSLLGFLRSFSTSFGIFMALEFLSSAFECGAYGAGFLLGLEFVGPKYRVFATTILVCFYAMGEVVLGFIAWLITDWRWYVRTVYLLGIACLPVIWYIPESVRWLATQKRYEDADKILKKVADINKTSVKKTIQELAAKSEKINEGEITGSRCFGENGIFGELLATMKSKPLLLRFINLAFCWATNTFVYYGLSLYSVSLSGNEYLNYILVCLVEMPANLLQYWMLDYCGRRFTQSSTLILSGICCLTFLFVPDDLEWLQYIFYLLGKFAITISFDAVYVYTAEMFPTNVRNSVLQFGSTFGRIGSTLAPLVPLLDSISSSLPMALFGGVSLLSGFLAILFPETKDRPLPETIEHAVNIGSMPRTTHITTEKENGGSTCETT